MPKIADTKTKNTIISLSKVLGMFTSLNVLKFQAELTAF